MGSVVNTDVKILGKVYSVRSDQDSSFASEAADFVDSKMRELAGKSAAIPTEKIAVLTAMNLAGELLRVQKREKNIRDSLRQKAQKLIKLIDSKI